MEIYNFRPTSQVEWQKIQFHHLRNQLFSVIFLVLGCHQLAPIERPTCDVPVVSTGQVRTREMLCSTDVLPRGDGNRGDWLLENQHLSVTVRNRDGALTDIQAFGGSAIDVSYGGADDVWIELLPVFSQPPRTLQLLPHNDSLEIIGENQRPVVRYKMNPDEAKLHISGPSEWILTPTIGSQVYGQVIAPHNANFVYYINGEIAQLDRGLQLTNPTSIVFTDWSTVYQNQDEQATWIEGEATGEWLVLYHDQEPIAQLPIVEDKYEGWIPPQTNAWKVTQKGCLETSPVELVTMPVLGTCGSVKIRVQNQYGEPLPATLLVEQNDHPVSPLGERIPVLPTTDELQIYAGPAYEKQTFRGINPETHPEFSIQLKRIIPESLLVHQKYITTTIPENFTQQQAALGSNFIVVHGADIILPQIPKASNHWDRHIAYDVGSFSTDSFGTLSSWPYTPNPNKPAYGAIPSFILTDYEPLIYATKNGRFAMVDGQWIENAEGLHSLPQKPDFLFVENQQDISIYTALLDEQAGIRPVGPYTWLHNLPGRQSPNVDIYAELLGSSTTIGNGPWISLREISNDPENEQQHIELRFAAPAWMNVTKIDLLSSNEELLYSQEISGSEFVDTFTVPKRTWLMAKAYGSEEIEHLQYQQAWGFTVLY